MQKIGLLIMLFVFMFGQNAIAQTEECDQTSIQLVINSGDWAEEITWSVYTSNGLFVDSLSTNYQNNTEYVHSLCLYNNTCYLFNLYDSYGDGWNGGTYLLQYEDSITISSGTLVGATVFGSNQFCINETSLCTSNYISLNFTTGTWAEEVSWSITDTLENLVDTLAISYLNNSTYNFQLCIEDGCYYLNMHDTYGDGWQGASFELLNANGEIFANGLLSDGSFGQIVFSLNSDCNIAVCEDENAINYNLISSSGSECFYQSENVNLLFNWFDASLQTNGLAGSYTEVYGYAENNKEYAIIGSTFGTHIIDVTNPTESYEVTRIPGAFSSSSVTHRDYHTMGKYLYAVCDQGESTLQIVDLSNLPDTAIVVYDSNDLFTRSHNIFIDTVSKKLYSCSTKGYDDLGDYWTSSLCVYDVSNPIQPTLLHNMSEYIPGTHDIWVDNDTAFINCPGTGTIVWEFNGSPSQVSTFTAYPDFGTNHSGWKSGDTYVFAEENNGYDLKVIDASDISNLELISSLNSEVNEFSIAHNLMIKDDLLYISYYWDGLQVFDISNPSTPSRIAYYDTYSPENFGGYRGAWGVYALLPSGNILISDITNGLFVLELSLMEEQKIPVQEGWNMVSTYLQNEDLDASLFTSPNNSNVVIMKNAIGLAYLPDWGFDGIGLLEYGQAYQMKVNILDTLSIAGVYSSSSNTIDLSEGWNMISVLSKSEMDLELILDNIIDDIIIVKDNIGSVYLPEWNFNSIGNVIPGQGYQLKLSNSLILSY
jgi:choice-of-anchor B domain-containing protein